MKEQNIVVKGLKEMTVETKQRIIYSEYLEREITVDIYVPVSAGDYLSYDLLLINDGQDVRTIDFHSMLNALVSTKKIVPLVCVGIHSGPERASEYGTICRADYMGRGARAGLYSKFVVDELLPWLKIELQATGLKNKSFAGFSLGGLSALDIAWNYPHEFSRVGVFSGSLWWRRHGYEDERYNSEKDRIMHLQLQKGTIKPGLKFFFECGKLDETADRNNNGIIDSIEDTIDLIEELKRLGYSKDHIYYLELEEGRHNLETWKAAFPAFLRWGWGNL